MRRPVVLYVDLMSQPARAVTWFCKLNKIPHELKLINIAKKENQTAEYSKINPFKKLPAIDDNGFILFESHAVLRYLSQRYDTPDHWYPKDLQRRARIDSYLDWHHTFLRKGATPFVFNSFIGKRIGADVSSSVVEQGKKDTEVAIQGIESFWLDNKKFIGGDEISIADLSATCELEQLTLINYDFTPFPNVSKYLKNMESLEFFNEVHQIVHKVKAKATREK